MRRALASKCICVDVEQSARNTLTSSMIMNRRLLNGFGWIYIGQFVAWICVAMSGQRHEFVWHCFWRDIAGWIAGLWRTRVILGGCHVFDTADNHSLVFDWSRIRRPAVDKAFMMLGMRRWTCDGQLSGGLGLFTMDRSGGAMVWRKVSVSRWTSWKMLPSSKFLFWGTVAIYLPNPSYFGMSARPSCLTVVYSSLVLLLYSQTFV